MTGNDYVISVSNKVETDYVSTENQVADIFTKPSARKKFERLGKAFDKDQFDRARVYTVQLLLGAVGRQVGWHRPTTSMQCSMRSGVLGQILAHSLLQA
jgi:aromatic ring hydroxylase